MFSSSNVFATQEFEPSIGTPETSYVASFNPSTHVDVKTLIETLGLANIDTLDCSGRDKRMAFWGEQLPRRRIAAGQTLVSASDAAKSLYVVRTGAFKSLVLDANGVAQIVGFPMRGELLGAEAFADGKYGANLIALEDSDVIVLSLARLAELSQGYPGFEQILFRSMARCLVREQSQLWTLGSQCATARLAQFLLQLSAFYAQAGYAANEFSLRMTRTDIASYLSLTIETVSRTFTTLQNARIVEIQQRSVKLLDVARLKQFCRGGERISAKELVAVNTKSSNIGVKLAA